MTVTDHVPPDLGDQLRFEPITDEGVYMEVAVAGLGRMGVAIAERLIEAGHDVFVYNRTSGRTKALVAAGAVEVSQLSELFSRASTVITMLADSAALLTVAAGPHGLLAGAGAAGSGTKVLIDMSTVSPGASERTALAAREAGVQYLRAPVSGNPGAVRAGRLGIVVSGSEEVFEAARALLVDIGPNVFYIGEGERARIMKLALNVMIAGTAELLAECLALCEAHGLDRSHVLDVTLVSAIGSPFVQYKAGPLLADDYATTFSTTLMRKDLTLALQSAEECGVDLPVAQEVAGLLDDCINRGFGELDFMVLLPRLQGRQPRAV